MQEAIQKADVLIEAMGWIRRFRDKVTVIKLGGSVMEDPQALEQMLVDVVFMETVGMRPVLVHGGGAAISGAMDQAGIVPRFIQGRRYTDQRTLEIAEHVLVDQINVALARQVESLGGRSVDLSFRTTNVLFGRPLSLDGPDGRPLDLGQVGRVTRVERAVLDNLCYAGQIPVIPSMCLDEETGLKLNVNADSAATAVAQAIGAEKLVFLSDVNGVRRDKQDPESLIHSLTAREARKLIAEGRIESGMIPKVEACLETLERGVRKVHIIDGRVKHSLLLEVYTNRGIGTELVEG